MQLSINFAAKYRSARERIFQLLADLEWHGHAELARVGGVRYGARLLELRRLGFAINDVEEGDGKRYRLVSLTAGVPQGKRVKVLLDEADADLLLSGVLSPRARLRLVDALASFRANRDKL